MFLPRIAIEHRVLTYFTTFLLIIGGVFSFFNLGQLEDPAYTVKTALIITPYPGASPEEVELELTNRIELAIQEIHELDYVESFSRAELSLIRVEIKEEFWADRLPQIWNTLRQKIRDTEDQLPPGAGRPEILDTFSDVFGFQLALIGEGFSYEDLESYAKKIKKELSLVKGIARIDLWGIQEKTIFVNISQPQIALLGVSDASILSTLNQQNMTVDAGSLEVHGKRYRIEPTGRFTSPEEIAQLPVRSTLADVLLNPLAESLGSGGKGSRLTGEMSRFEEEKRTGEMIRIGDFATVKRGHLTPPHWMMRYNNQPSIGISIMPIEGSNVVDIGKALDARLAELQETLPVGIELNRIHWQSDVIAEAVNGFLINFAEAVLIVLIVLTLTMGWRMSIVIGTALLVTILTTLILMDLFDINLQRMSLGALIIALGMMVDNSIVVADGYVVRLKQGMLPSESAIQAASLPAWPLFGATVIAVMAFFPIFGSVESAGEYCRTLFTVVAMSLLSSWFVSMVITPLQCLDMLPADQDEGNTDPYGNFFFSSYRKVLHQAIRKRKLTLGIMFVLLIFSSIGFGRVEQLFFSDSSMTKFMINFWSPEGTRIQTVADDLQVVEKKLLTDEKVSSVSTFIGQGAPRFYLPVDPEYPYSSYGQLIVDVHDFHDIDGLIEEFNPWFKENLPDAMVSIKKYTVGPGYTWQLEVRFIGSADADPAVLRQLGEQGVAIIESSPLVSNVRLNWRQRVQKITPEYNQDRARWTAISRLDIANATKLNHDGKVVGLYKENDDLIPIIARLTEHERKNVDGFDLLQVRSPLGINPVPLAQVIDGYPLKWEESMIWRRDRHRTITIQANPAPGETLPTLRNAVLQQLEAIELPPGYTMEWGAEYDDTIKAQQSLIPGAIPAAALILFIMVALFNALRPPAAILIVLPFALIGITTGFLLTGAPFGFMALLGTMSLIGMLIKNSIVLLDQVHNEQAKGKSHYQALQDASVSRLQPVFLAAATTVLGVIPLLQDVFWVGLSVSIMFGLSFGYILTMIIVPVLYALLYQLEPDPA